MTGLTLLEMAVALIIIGLLAAVGAYTTPWINEELQRERTRKALDEASEALVAFARTHHRLPCPDGDSDGEEDCGTASGTLPHLDLLLDAPVLDQAHRPVVYAVYRRTSGSPALDSDLASLVNRFDAYDETAGSLNACDFCEALRTPVPGGPVSGYASTSTQFTAGGCTAGNVLNQAFVVASYGIEDRDGAADAADGDNGDGNPVCFSSPLRGRDDSFDDIVRAMDFATLAGRLCP